MIGAMKILATIFFLVGICGSLRADMMPYSVEALSVPSLSGIAVFGLNDLGQVAGYGYYATTDQYQAFIGTTSGSTLIPLPSGWTSALGYNINDSGQVAGWGYNSVGTEQGFIGTTGGSTAIPLLPGASFAVGSGINGSGQVAGGVYNGTGRSQAFIGTTSGSTLIPLPLGWSGSNGYGINDYGQVTGSVCNNGVNCQAFIGTTSGSTLIPLPSGGWTASFGYGINNYGQVAGYGTNGSGFEQAFIGTTSGSTAIPLPAGCTSAVLFYPNSPINDLGEVVGVASGNAPNPLAGWIWDPADGTQLLSSLVDPSWDIFAAISINNEGQILAEATNTDGFEGYVLLDPVPEPGSVVLLITAVGLIAFAHGRACRKENPL
jgi:hypothetical protein